MSNSTLKVLIVDDEPELLELLETHLELHGYLVKKASNGLTAWQIIQAEPIDVVVTDVYMPCRTGLELLDDVRHRPCHKPRMIVTSGSYHLSESLILAKGAEAFLPKPTNLRTLLSHIEDSIRFDLTVQHQVLQSIG
ncbi:response regulator [Pseudobacteriovorax antillogorgiicola]|uniref:Response regulator receiver domain-containing protein n=1 Tax=Pseudobacteriovorax antillogorgiicola TaxID=1513793 RepID=A0A1Y6CA03_9BACT|nr:response regulator [Pseudobacteriovorax antillogorgiicola]TCS51775.1 response regulator receiver domain-containing protein [Pseudobacteriovorax antillogorgiicola]SMF49894.1 Response regulator receiver domain-containing protein [Pseudobacteriovorax antillogorgiicola]